MMDGSEMSDSMHDSHLMDAPESIDVDRLVEFALAYMKVSEECEVSVAFVDEELIRSLNLEYRGIDAPTDVLSFECDKPSDLLDPQDVAFPGQCVLGDIVICEEIAKRNASEYQNSIDSELELLIVHGVLHLLGYDHEDDLEAEEMEGLERRILRQWRSADEEVANERAFDE